MNVDLLHPTEAHPALMVKASFDLVGVTESLEKGSQSLQNNNDSKINKQDQSGGNSKDQNIKIEKLDPTNES